ncbi:hypothetical protein PF005_g5255 [Phytophthora fragariae]|uniref:Uncharacterized protein n=1 Tax=Phytophthora fragariae TaxID=53985 RepID=A0A6A3KHJ6_9STRA|nr:hypothetical protein PF011_g11386 [Phytophthora fragariae]KAE9226133.1 hypothetical protein PF005_g5255 [Phytophthora fragariae]KAE9248073.1 hypothetical protein PF002_g5981 [Phytophthora fragariae]
MMPVLETALAYDAMNVVQMVQRASENYELSQKTVYTLTLALEMVAQLAVSGDDNETKKSELLTTRTP